MFNKGDYIVYKHDVCLIAEIRKNALNNREYYILKPVNDSSLKIDVPVENRLNNIRRLINKTEIKELIKKIKDIPIINTDNKLIENEYKKMLSDGSFESLISIIKTTYLRNKERVDNNRKAGDKDTYYFALAEKYLYTEFSIALNKSYDESQQYVINEIEKGKHHE